MSDPVKLVKSSWLAGSQALGGGVPTLTVPLSSHFLSDCFSKQFYPCIGAAPHLGQRSFFLQCILVQSSVTYILRRSVSAYRWEICISLLPSKPQGTRGRRNTRTEAGEQSYEMLSSEQDALMCTSSTHSSCGCPHKTCTRSKSSNTPAPMLEALRRPHSYQKSDWPLMTLHCSRNKLDTTIRH